MTWNVFWRWGGTFARRSPAIADTVRQCRPDVLGLVETWAGDGTDQPAQLAAALGTAHSLFAPTSLPPEPVPIEYPEQEGIRVGIGLVSRWPIAAPEIHELPHEQRGGAPPTAIVATLGRPDGPLRVIVTCLEWEPHYRDDQAAQAAAVAALAGDGPVLVLGDLNAGIEDAAIAPLTGGFTDTYAAGGGDPHARTLDSAVPYAPLEATHLIDRRIDHILVRDAGREVTVSAAALAGDRPVAGLYPSDHYAVVVDLEL